MDKIPILCFHCSFHMPRGAKVFLNITLFRYHQDNNRARGWNMGKEMVKTTFEDENLSANNTLGQVWCPCYMKSTILWREWCSAWESCYSKPRPTGDLATPGGWSSGHEFPSSTWPHINVHASGGGPEWPWGLHPLSLGGLWRLWPTECPWASALRKPASTSCHWNTCQEPWASIKSPITMRPPPTGTWSPGQLSRNPPGIPADGPNRGSKVTPWGSWMPTSDSMSLEQRGHPAGPFLTHSIKRENETVHFRSWNVEVVSYSPVETETESLHSF